MLYSYQEDPDMANLIDRNWWKSWVWVNKEHSADDPNACAVCYSLDYSEPFVKDTSPKSIDREGLGGSRKETRQSGEIVHVLITTEKGADYKVVYLLRNRQKFNR